MHKVVHSHFTVLISFLIIGIIVYLPALHSFFLADDFEVMEWYSSNDLFCFANVLFVPFTDIRPVANLIKFILFTLFETNTFIYHFHNILIHCINGILVFHIAKLLISANSKNNLSFLTGILFLILPYQTEAVSWIAGIGDLYATFFGFCSLYSYLKYLQSYKKQNLILSLLFFITGAFTKESIFILPLIITVVAHFRKSKTLKHFLTFSCTLIFCVLIRIICYGGIIRAGSNFYDEFDFLIYIKNYFYYLVKFFGFYRYLPSEIKSIFKILIEFKWVVLILIIAGSFILRKKLFNAALQDYIKETFLFFSLFTISLLPVLNLETSFLGDSQADRYGYFPSLFVCIIWILFINKIISNIKFKYSIYVLFFLIMIIWTYQTNINWKIAGEISRKIIMAESDKILKTKETAVILNLPDNYKGAFILRSGFEEGVRLFKKTRQEYYVISTNSLVDVNEEIEISRMDENTIRVSPLNSQSYLLYLHNNKNSLPSDIRITEQAKNYYILEKQTKSIIKLFYYSENTFKDFYF